jgi:hypothetical protein
MNESIKLKLGKRLRGIMEFVASKSPRILPIYEKITDVFKEYEKYKLIIHKRMGKIGQPDEKKLMDQHKIAAAFLCSILRVKPMGFMPDRTIQGIDYIEDTCNEQVGFMFGLYLLELFNRNMTDTTAENKLAYQLPIELPRCEEDDYIVHFIKLLDTDFQSHLFVEHKNFQENLLFYLSHIFFLIDSYSYEAARSKVLSEQVTKQRWQLSELEKRQKVPEHSIK